jgi:L-threonylcarbamoyladenylate synthase
MKTRVLEATMADREKAARSIETAVELILKGGVVVFPTETSYGIGADATNEQAIRKVFGLKGREHDKGLPVIAGDLAMMRQYGEITPQAEKLARSFMPGPLTLVVERKPGGLPEALGGQGVAFRIPGNEIARAISEEAGVPITSTSANKSGEPSLYKASEVRREFEGRVDAIISSGDLSQTPSSTIVDLRAAEPRLVRDGPVPFKEVLATLKQQ